eukprot:GHVN01058637.1.p1 GENE.GHVN01058637.1~~GHVN01058637.1.p1  ORF type:complete len:380 (+),score=51.67 GHVN01058637.1:1318-2457(+)
MSFPSLHLILAHEESIDSVTVCWRSVSSQTEDDSVIPTSFQSTCAVKNEVVEQRGSDLWELTKCDLATLMENNSKLLMVLEQHGTRGPTEPGDTTVPVFAPQGGIGGSNAHHVVFNSRERSLAVEDSNDSFRPPTVEPTRSWGCSPVEVELSLRSEKPAVALSHSPFEAVAQAATASSQPFSFGDSEEGARRRSSVALFSELRQLYHEKAATESISRENNKEVVSPGDKCEDHSGPLTTTAPLETMDGDDTSQDCRSEAATEVIPSSPSTSSSISDETDGDVEVDKTLREKPNNFHEKNVKCSQSDDEVGEAAEFILSQRESIATGRCGGPLSASTRVICVYFIQLTLQQKAPVRKMTCHTPARCHFASSDVGCFSQGS